MDTSERLDTMPDPRPQSSDPDAVAICEALKRIGLSKAQLADRAGIGVATVYNFLAGEIDPIGSTRQALLKAAGVKVSYELPAKIRGAKPRGPGRPPKR